MTTKFKVGDKVRCVNPGCNSLELGARYEIRRTDKIDGEELVVLVEDSLGIRDTPWLATSFELVTPVPVPSSAILPTDSDERKQIPVYSGVLAYFPLAIAAVARLSKRGNDKHNPGEPLHWSRGKSTDHEDCIARHLIDVDTLDASTGEYEDAVALAWRALAKLQLLEEKRLNKAPSRASK